MEKILISVEDLEATAELNDSDTARAIADALPLEGTVNVWGDEIYFDIPVHLEQAPDARKEVAGGDLGYWPVGSAFCIFFGPTPVSIDGTPRAYSPVNGFGRVTGDPLRFKSVSNGATIRIQKESFQAP